MFLNLDTIPNGANEGEKGGVTETQLRHALLQALYNRVDEGKHAVLFGMMKDLQMGRLNKGEVQGLGEKEVVMGGREGALYFSKIGYCPPEKKVIKKGGVGTGGGAGGVVATVPSSMRMAPEVVRRLGKKKVVVDVYLEKDDFDWGWLVGVDGEKGGEGPMVTVSLLQGQTCVHLRHEIWQELYDRCPKGLFYQFFFFLYCHFIIVLFLTLFSLRSSTFFVRNN